MSDQEYKNKMNNHNFYIFQKDESNSFDKNIQMNNFQKYKKCLKLLGNKMKRKKSKTTPKQDKTSSKSKTNYKTPNSPQNFDIFNQVNNIKEIKLNVTSCFCEQIITELNKEYINQNAILMKDYMKSLEEFDPFKRNILMDWVMAICTSNRFKRETFHMTVSLIDICLTKLNQISLDKVQLLATTCLLISSKYLEVFIPSIKQYSYFTAETYSVQEIKYYEIAILNLLDWKINYVDIYQWSNLILYKWKNYINEYSNIFQISEKDINKIYILYYNTLDCIILDYYYRFYNMKYLCLALIYLLFGYEFGIIDEECINLSEIKYYNNFFNNFVEKNNIFGLDNFRKYILYVLQFTSKKIISSYNEDITYLNKSIFIQDYDENKIKIAKSVIKNQIYFYNNKK